MKVEIEIEKYREDPNCRTWDLPAWGHPLSQGVFPLFMTLEDCLHPIGTAFTIGQKVTFVVTATHNVREMLKHEERLSHLLTARSLPGSIDFREVGLSVLYQRANEQGGITFAIWPMETIDAAPPTDVVVGHPVFQTQQPNLTFPIGFDLPDYRQKIWSVGYTAFEYPDGGIPLAGIRAGTFDWQQAYRHRFQVVEGFVEAVFAQGFASGFIDGPCFMFDASIGHGLSGGPVFSMDGVIRGINSAGAEHFYNRAASIASLMFPLLPMKIRFGANLGPVVRINAAHPLMDLIASDTIATDGSEQHLGLRQDADSDSLMVSPTMPKSLAGHIHNDFRGFQRGEHATTENGPVFRMRRVAGPMPESDAPS